MNMGENLKRIRKWRGLTQKDLATELAKATGMKITPQTISYWENGRQINTNVLEDIAQVLHVGVVEFLHGAGVSEKILESDVKRKDGLTSEEGKVMDLLIEAWNRYIKLPKQHPTEIDEFGQGIHICQNLLAIRIARRCYPKGWPIKTNK